MKPARRLLPSFRYHFLSAPAEVGVHVVRDGGGGKERAFSEPMLVSNLIVDAGKGIDKKSKHEMHFCRSCGLENEQGTPCCLSQAVWPQLMNSGHPDDAETRDSEDATNGFYSGCVLDRATFNIRVYGPTWEGSGPAQDLARQTRGWG